MTGQRKALGHVHGRAVRFGSRHRRTLLVGEGIETVLSLIAAVPAIPAAAALSAGSLGAFAPPSGLARLVIARDNDAEGERAARRLRRRCDGLGIATAVVAPQRGDFNDDLIAFGPASARHQDRASVPGFEAGHRRRKRGARERAFAARPGERPGLHGASSHVYGRNPHNGVQT